MSSIKYNASKTYLLPLLSEIILFDIKFIDYLENTFLFFEDSSLDKNIKYIGILHEFNFRNPEFTSYEHKFTDNYLFVKCVDIDSKVLYIFKFPEEYYDEYDFLLKSQYSKFGDDAKKLIIRFWTSMYGKTPSGISGIMKIKQILYKDTKLKEQLEKKLKVVLSSNSELGEYVKVKDETFKLENFVENKI